MFRQAGMDVPGAFRHVTGNSIGRRCLMMLLLSAISVLLLAGPGFTAEEGSIQVKVLAKTGSSWDGSALPPYPAGTPEVTVLRITVPPGVRLPLHEHPVINSGVLLRGELTVITTEGKTLHLHAGDAIVEVVNKWHYGKNEGSEPAEIIVFYAGVKDKPITLKR